MAGMISVETVEEHEDGSATVVFECNDEAKKQLIEEGLISLLKKSVGMEEGERKEKENEKANDTGS